MNRRQIRKLRKQAEHLAAKKRQQDLLKKACPACGYTPARMIPVGQDTGLDIHTGKPPCSRCRDIQEKYMPDRFNVIEIIPVYTAQDGRENEGPDGPDDPGPAAAAAGHEDTKTNKDIRPGA